MNRIVPLTLAMIFSTISATEAATANQTCGGTKAVVGMTLGYVSDANSKLHARSLEALSAIYVGSDKNIVGWLGLDNRGNRWIQFGHGGEELRNRLGTAVLRGSPAMLFSPINEATFMLPMNFSVEPCTYVDTLTK